MKSQVAFEIKKINGEITPASLPYYDQKSQNPKISSPTSQQRSYTRSACMYRSAFPGFAAFVLDAYFKTVNEAFGEINAPQKIFAG